MRNHYKLIVGLALGLALAAGGSAWAASEFDIANEEHTNTATRVGHKRAQLVTSAGAELGTAANPLRVSPGTSPAVQPVSDNGASLTVDGTVAATVAQLPAALATSGRLKAEDCAVNFAAAPVKATCASTGQTSMTIPAGYYMRSIVGGETGRFHDAPAVSCAADPADVNDGALVVGDRVPAYFASETTVCCYSATSAALAEFKACL